MIQPSDEELLAAIATGPGALTEFYRRHVARMTGMGVRRFDNPEDVADCAVFCINLPSHVIMEEMLVRPR